MKNQAACNSCGEIIESTHRHDFKWCSCGRIAVDGGKDYLKRSFGKEGYKELSIMEEE